MKQSLFVGTCVVLLTVTFIVCPIHGDAKEKIIIIGTQDADDLPEGQWLKMVYTEVFRRLGYQFEFQSYPIARASKLADNGKVDGEMYRARDYVDAYKNLIIVEQSGLVTINLVAYAARSGIQLNGWDSLQNTEYKVEYRRGIKKAENILSKIVKAENLSVISQVEQGLKKLIMGRTDIYIDAQIAVIDALRKLDANNFDLLTVYPVCIVESIPLYLFLHKKNADLVPKVTEVLLTMRQEGLIETLRVKAMPEH